MKILILGATGFIGKALFNALISEHEIYVASRSPILGYDKYRKIDFDDSINISELLQDIEMVINTIGIASGDFTRIQTDIPIKIFQECKKKDIKIINISAIGAEKEKPLTNFLVSKKITDEFILNKTSGIVIYPGIVLGENSQSSELFKELSELPIVPLIGNKKIPFVHIIQLVEVIKETIHKYEFSSKQKIVIAEPQTLKEIFIALNNKSITTINVSTKLVSFIFKVLPNLRLGVFDKNMYTLFQEINSLDYKPSFKEKASNYLIYNKINPSNHLLKLYIALSISFIWIWSGMVSLYSWQESKNLMQAIGITNQLSPISIIIGSIVDIVLGIGIFINSYRSFILKLQIFFIVIYSLILTFFAHEFWLHPFGPVAKNIPLIVLIYLYYKWNK